MAERRVLIIKRGCNVREGSEIGIKDAQANVFRELSEECSASSFEVSVAVKAGNCPYIEELSRVFPTLDELANHSITLESDLLKSVEINEGKLETVTQLLSYLKTIIENLTERLEEIRSKGLRECANSSKCCLVTPLLESSLERLSKCNRTLDTLIEIFKKGGCSKCLYYSKTTGLCVRTRKKTLGIPVCGGKYFTESSRGSS